MVATQLTTHALPDFHYAATYHLCGVPDNLCTHILCSVVYTEDVNFGLCHWLAMEKGWSIELENLAHTGAGTTTFKEMHKTEAVDET
jgi:hypothetical protein